MKLKIRRFLLFCLWTCVLIVITGITISSNYLDHDNYISFLIFAAIVFLHSYKAKTISAKNIVCHYLGSFTVVVVIIASLEGWKGYLIGAPNFLFLVLGMISGYLIYTSWQQKLYRRLVFPIFFFGLALLQAFVFFPYWVHFVFHGNFTGKVKEPLPISSHVNSGVEQLFRDKSKLYLLDFWSTSCGVCFKKFPKLQALYNQYKNGDSVAVIAINIRLPRDTTGMAQQEITSRGYSFPVIVANDTFRNSFGVQGFPTVVMVKGNEIIFRGDIETAETFLKK